MFPARSKCCCFALDDYMQVTVIGIPCVAVPDTATINENGGNITISVLANDGFPGAARNTSSVTVSLLSGSSQVFVLQAVDQPWLSTGLTPLAGTQIALSASGVIQPVPSGDWAWRSGGYGPDGVLSSSSSAYPICSGMTNVDLALCPIGCCPAYSTRGYVSAPGPNLPALALVGRWGLSGAPFFIGSTATLTAPGGALLYVALNDWNFSDNSGSWTITATIQG